MSGSERSPQARVVRAAVTGMGIWSCFGSGVEPLLAALRSGQRGWRPVEGMGAADAWLATDHAMQAVKEEHSDRLSTEEHPWPLQMALSTALAAVKDAGLERVGRCLGPYRAERVAVCNGTTHGADHGIVTYLRQRVETGTASPQLLAHATGWVARQIAQETGAAGPNLTLDTACSAGLNAIGQASKLLQSGRADVVIAGGHDVFSYLNFVGFNSLKALDPQGCRPFSLDRQGLSLGDGAGYVVLEPEAQARARGAQIFGVITGYGNGGEGYHPTSPDPEGHGAFRAMQQALRAEDIHALRYISAHGTGTPANDGAELSAIQRLLEQRAVQGPVYISSLKRQLGHTLGGAGAMQVVVSLACMSRGLIPGNPGLTNPIPHPPSMVCLAEPLQSASPIPLTLCNSFGFGGSVASLCLRLE